MQVIGKLAQQRHVSGLSLFGNFFKIHHQTVILVRCQECVHLLEKYGMSFFVIQKMSNVHPAHPVGIVHHGKNFHGRILRPEEGHDIFIHRADRGPLHYVVIRISLGIHPL